MTVALQIVALLCALTLFTIYLGYPLVLIVLGWFSRGGRLTIDEQATPPVTLLISCFNEEQVLEAKLANALALDYPGLEIVVVSDASDDRTDEIARAHADRGVKLVRQPERRGKTSALNLAMQEARGELIVFSDANAMYEPDAIGKLVRNFADPRVGYVVGEARYVAPGEASGASENLYWKYEMWIKRQESRIHSMVGGDGAIYAIRRELWQPLRVDDINDFVNPLQIVARGYRGIYEPEAVALEETAGSFDKEFRRKARIVNRAFTGLMRVAVVLNPFRTGLFAFEVLFHKLLRWLAPLFIVIFVGCTVALSLMGNLLFTAIGVGCLLFYLAFYIGWLGGGRLPLVSIPYYFVLVNAASLIGVWNSLRGRVQATWSSPRARGSLGGRHPAALIVVHVVLVGWALYLWRLWP